MKVLNIAVISLLLTSCAMTPEDYPKEVHAKAREIKMFPIGVNLDKKYEEVKVVKSNSCGDGGLVRIYGDITQAELLLRLEAASLNADAVINYKCWTQGVDLVSNCWASKRCEGTAIKYKDKE